MRLLINTILIRYLVEEMKVLCQQTINIKGYSFNREDILGKGVTGYVYKGLRLKDNVSVAIKAIEMSKINNEVTKYLLEGEKKAMMTIKNNYIVRCEEIIQQKDYCYIVMEICRGGTLKQYIKNKGPIPEKQAIQMFRKIITGYLSIIDNRIIHRDLKTQNIMLRYNDEPVIIDFGYCEMIMAKRPLLHYNVGSPSYMSPEAHHKNLYSEKSDVWALGVIFYQMLTGYPLDFGKSTKDYFFQIQRTNQFNFSGFPFCQLTKTLLQKSLEFDSQKRATSQRLKYFIDKEMIGKEILPINLLSSMKSLVLKKTVSERFEKQQTLKTDRVQNKIQFQKEINPERKINSPYRYKVQIVRPSQNIQFRYPILRIPSENQAMSEISIRQTLSDKCLARRVM